MLRNRVLTAMLLVPLVVACVLWLPSFAFLLCAEVVMLAVLWEWQRLSGLNYPPLVAVLYFVLAAALMAALGAYAYSAPMLWLAVMGVAWWCLAAVWLSHPGFGAGPGKRARLLKALAGLFTVIPAWVLLGELHAAERGAWWVLLLLTLVWTGDVAAYFAGRRFGRRKLAPVISPNKTWAGVWGGVIGSVAVALGGGILLDLRGTDLALLGVLALITIGFAMIGDLYESLVKRQAGAKDSSTLLPGHGGVLDRMDSLCAAVPVFALGHAFIFS